MPRYSSDFFFSPRPTKQRRKNDREREQREIELAISLSLLTRSPLPLFSFSLSSHGDVVSSHALGVAAFCAARSSSGSSSSAPPALEDGRGTAALDGDGADAAARRIRAPPGPLRRRRERRAEPALQLQGSRGVPVVVVLLSLLAGQHFLNPRPTFCSETARKELRIGTFDASAGCVSECLIRSPRGRKDKVSTLARSARTRD